LLELQNEQIRLDEAAAKEAQATREQRIELQVRRDSALRALLGNDADRAMFDSNSTQTGAGPRSGGAGGARGEPGGRGRVGGAADSVLRQIAGRAGGRGARGGGAAGGDVREVAVTVNNIMVEMTYRRLFRGISLTADQEARARDLISSTQPQVRPNVFPLKTVLRMNPRNGLVSMSAENAAALSALLTSDADRATLLARIVEPGQ
jgi:hypothetical protein